MKKKFISLVLFCTAQVFFAQTSQVFTVSGNFVVPSGITSVTIEVVGAGGNGAGNGGGGGGGGGYAKGIFAVTPGTVLTVNIGTAGSGSSGGSTSVTGLLSATGGANGTTVGNPNIGGGGAGGSGSNGNVVNRTGGNGGGGYWTYYGGGGGGAGGPVSNGTNGGNTIAYNGSNCLTPGGSGGLSGGAPGGNGGKGAGFIDSQCNVADPAAPGSIYGGGGGGGNGNSSPAQSGSGGYCKIEYGVCVAPAAPAISANSSMTLCSGNAATLVASGSGTIHWYTGSTGGTTVATGSTFVTSALTTTTTFYASSETCTSSVQRTPFTVTVFPSPVVTLSASPAPYCVNQPITFTAAGAPNYVWNSGATGSNQTITPQGTVVFPPTVTGTGTNGCSSSASMALVVNPQPTLSILPSTTLCAGQIITYTVTGAANYSWTNGPQSSTYSVAVNSGSVFNVTGTSSAGCSNTAAITQTVIPNPTVAIVVGKTEVCIGESTSLSVSGANTYSWTGHGTNSMITVSPVVSTIYTVTGFNAEGCESVSTQIVNVQACVSIKESSVNKKVLVYPNPSEGLFTIKSDDETTLYIYSYSGQLLQVTDLNNTNGYKCTIEGLSRGIYFITDDKRIFAQKIVVE